MYLCKNRELHTYVYLEKVASCYLRECGCSYATADKPATQQTVHRRYLRKREIGTQIEC